MLRVFVRPSSALLVLTFLPPALSRAADPTTEQAEAAIRKAVEFFHWEVSSHGGYVWRYSTDLTSRKGEAVVEKSRVWVQPPGTPSVGEAMLHAYEATGDPYVLDAARDTGYALCKGQMRSGGWAYLIEFNPDLRRKFDYREVEKPKAKERTARMTTLDDNTTQAATRFLVLLDQALKFEDTRIHDAATYALNALVNAQHPNGGWSVWWVTYPETPSTADDYPVKPASFPDDWPRTWPKDFTGCYVTNDNLMPDMIDLMLLAHQVYNDGRYLESAKNAGQFLLLAQMPDPQPAWAQQYDKDMHPVWSRKFEPPAVSGGESQNIMLSLMRLYSATGDEAYLKPIPKALAYLKRSALPDGRLARFYELQTNKPIYFTKDYKITYSSDDMPTHYGFIVDSKLARIEARLKRVRAKGAGTDKPRSPKRTPALLRDTRNTIGSMDGRGAWTGKAKNGSAILESVTFENNLGILSDFVSASK